MLSARSLRVFVAFCASSWGRDDGVDEEDVDVDVEVDEAELAEADGAAASIATASATAAAAAAGSAAPAVTATAAPQEEVVEWDVFHDESGVPFFTNRVTGESVWDKPANFRCGLPPRSFVVLRTIPCFFMRCLTFSCPCPSALPCSFRCWTRFCREWEELLHAESGLPYYFNCITNETVWERPAAFEKVPSWFVSCLTVTLAAQSCCRRIPRRSWVTGQRRWRKMANCFT
jgi:hypothetical protein